MTEEHLTSRWHKDVNGALPNRAPSLSASRGILSWLALVGVVGAVGGLYFPTLRWLVQSWGRDEYYAHGPLLPFISAYLIWQKQGELRAAWMSPRTPDLVPSWLIWLALGMQIFGSLVEMNVMRALQAASIPIFLLGVGRYWGGKSFAQELRFPLLFLWLCVPISGPMVEVLTIPLQRYAASASAMVLGLLGMPITREGVNLYTPLYHFVVAVPCSGLKITITLFTLGVLIAHFMPKLTLATRAFLALCSIPVALLANTLRVITIILIGFNYGPKAAEGFLHSGSGLFMFTLSLAALMGLGGLLVRHSSADIADKAASPKTILPPDLPPSSSSLSSAARTPTNVV